MTWVNCATGACAVVMMLCGAASATTIVAYRTDAHFAIAADSLRSHEVRLGKTQSRACKIFEQAGAIFAMSGIHSPVFDPKQVVREALTGRTSIRDAAVALATRLPKFYQSWLAQLRPHILDQIRNGDASKAVVISSVVLGAYEGGGPSAAALDISLSPGYPVIVGARLAWLCDSAGCDHPFAFLGNYQVIVRRINAFRPGLPPEASNRTAAENAASLVQLEIDAKTPTVGPPIAVAQVGADGVSWPHAEMCGSTTW